MPTSRPSEHQHEILDQFTRQATPFATAPGIRDEAALRLIVECSGAGPEDTVLDVACGPGLVVAAFARVVRHATGIDITPAMLERARAHAGELESLIGRSFPHPGDDEKIREIFRAALADDALDIQPRLENGQIRYGFPVSVLVAAG